jgi:hypothetical protein
MPDYNYDMQQLQQDAIRRAREMQARAQIPVPRPPPPPQVPHPVPNTPVTAPRAPQIQPPREHHTAPILNQPEHEPPKSPLNPLTDIFESLLSDSERTLILVLILLLVEEKADTGLIFALMYLAL